MRQLTVYLAGPIDDISKPEAEGWRSEIVKAWPDVLFFDPNRAWRNAHANTARAVTFGNRVAIVHIDGLLANLSGPGRGFGTIREIEFARAQGKPVAVAGEVVSLMSTDLILKATVDEAMDVLMQTMADRLAEPKIRGFMLPLEAISEEEDDDEH